MFVKSIVEVTNDNIRLAVTKGFLLVRNHETEIETRIPIDNILSILINNYSTVFTQNFVLRLSEEKIPIIVCGSNHFPQVIMWPTESHHQQKYNLQMQLNASVPLKKNLWKLIIKCKIMNQAVILKKLSNENYPALNAYARRVKSGDIDNIEAQAARLYWSNLFGKKFIRDRRQINVNSALNYGYTVLRSAVARYVIASGLNAALGVHHRNLYNAFCLVDDLIEPFRPLFDYVVKKMFPTNFLNELFLKAADKKMLTEILTWPILKDHRQMTVNEAIKIFVQSYLASLKNQKAQLILPHYSFDVQHRLIFEE